MRDKFSFSRINPRQREGLQQNSKTIKKFRVERFVASPLPHRSVRADFPHTVPLLMVSLPVGPVYT
ncbi:MAG TPA: hypothetical protein VKA34_10835, partial [Balneolales bacterium]|nr:hypothetical protein [Balneolales bacterium]